MNEQHEPPSDERAPAPAWVRSLVLGLLAAYVLVLAIGVAGVLFDIQGILDFFAFLTP